MSATVADDLRLSTADFVHACKTHLNISIWTPDTKHTQNNAI